MDTASGESEAVETNAAALHAAISLDEVQPDRVGLSARPTTTATASFLVVWPPLCGNFAI